MDQNQSAWLYPFRDKVAVWFSKNSHAVSSFRLVDAATGKTVYEQLASKNFGAYGAFNNTSRLNFTAFKKSGKYYLAAAMLLLRVLNRSRGLQRCRQFLFAIHAATKEWF